MSNTPFFIYWDIFYCIYYDIFWRNIFFICYLRLHQCFFLGASCCSQNFCFSTLR